VTEVARQGLGIVFSAPVESADMTDHSIFALTTRGNPNPPRLWYELALKLIPGNFATNNPSSAFTAATGLVNGVRLISMESTELRILVKGDLIRAADGRGVDGDQLPPWLPKQATGDGIQGGTFESWLNLSRQ
jgi:hypothetical protein